MLQRRSPALGHDFLRSCLVAACCPPWSWLCGAYGRPLAASSSLLHQASAAGALQLLDDSSAGARLELA
eukprot:9834012-Alexandrium_andersonii.AAC.1